MFRGLTLVVPEKRDVERDAVCSVWQHNDGSLLRLGRFWEPPPLESASVRLYGPDTFCLVLAQKLKFNLLSPDDSLLARLDSKWLKRAVLERSLDDLHGLDFPLFVKPAVPKPFRAAVYSSASTLQAECKGLESATPILTSDPVAIVAEARAFILDGNVMTCSVYEGDRDWESAASIAKQVAASYEFPKTFVIDVAYIADSGWAILEFNATWGAGLNGCDPSAVASCIAHATQCEP